MLARSSNLSVRVLLLALAGCGAATIANPTIDPATTTDAAADSGTALDAPSPYAGGPRPPIPTGPSPMPGGLAPMKLP